ncbi:ATP-binding cassette sub-family B member 10, mitochondrial isoform X2 [Photinus pyralis]|nr:ATP-binding cassette sub-family B member 10, mitochondrial isoform X2 [Photinus pyralis]XP_031341752.1 ATP-binding cassette sub-family B member 10, mitochondrial isoform X2 [Photinus pyralis]
MTSKVTRSQSYVSINVAENTNSLKRSRFHIFVRKVSNQKSSKPKEKRLSRADLVRLFSLAKPEAWKLMGAVCLLFISSAVTMAVPFTLGKVLDIIYTNSDNVEEARSKMNRLCGILIAVFIVGGICNFGRVYIMSTSGYRMTQSLRLRVFSSVLKQEQGWFDTRPTGELINRLSSDTQIVGQALTTNISDGLRSTIMVLAGSGMMFYMSPELALVGLAIVPPVAVLAVIYGRFVRRITTNVQDTLAGATQVSEERISNIRTVKTFSRESREIETYTKAIQEVLKLGYKESKARAFFFGMTGFSGNIIIISVLYYGGVMVSSQAITVGNLSSFLLYAAYIGVSVGGLSSFYSELNKSVGAATRLWELVDREPLIPLHDGLHPLSPPQGHITFKNVEFSYPSRNDIKVLNDLILDVTPGRTLAVVGPSGSGKSTLAALLLRLYDPDKGVVYLDGEDVKQLDPSWLRRHIGTVSQEPTLFSSSIRENILYGAEEPDKVTEEHFMQVVKEANVYEFVKQLPQGFDTVVGERGIMLSGGQKQRVAIARALIKNPKILLLDEATSALDAQSEYLVQEALERVMKGRTVLTIAHRLSTIQNADLIAVLQDGQVVEKGTYHDLMQCDKGPFRELIKHQTFQEAS